MYPSLVYMACLIFGCALLYARLVLGTASQRRSDPQALLNYAVSFGMLGVGFTALGLFTNPHVGLASSAALGLPLSWLSTGCRSPFGRD